MSENIKEEYQTPWDMPNDIFWDHGEHAELNRLQWIRENHPDLTLEEITDTMPFRPNVIATYQDERHTTEAILVIHEAATDVAQEARYRKRLLKLSGYAMKFDPKALEKIEI